MALVRLKAVPRAVDRAGTSSEGGTDESHRRRLCLLCCVACYSEAGRFRDRYGRTPFGWSQGCGPSSASCSASSASACSESLSGSAATQPPSSRQARSSRSSMPPRSSSTASRSRIPMASRRSTASRVNGQAPYGSPQAAYAPPPGAADLGCAAPAALRAAGLACSTASGAAGTPSLQYCAAGASPFRASHGVVGRPQPSPGRHSRPSHTNDDVPPRERSRNARVQASPSHPTR